MLLGIIFIILNIFSGIIIINLLKFKFKSKLSNIISGAFIGSVLNLIIGFILAVIIKDLFISLTISLGYQIVFIGIFNKKISFQVKKITKKELFFSIILLLILIFLNFSIILVNKGGNHFTGGDLWFDNALHLTLINSFSKSDNFFPMNPYYYGERMSYHFLFDFYSAILNKLGFSIDNSIIISNIIFLFFLFYFFFYFSFEILKSKRAAIISLILLFFSGGLYFIEILMRHNITGILNGNYASYWDLNYLMVNFIINILTTRASILGYGLLLFIFIYIIPFILENKILKKNQIIFLGILAGFLPFIHAHSLIALLIIVTSLTIFLRKKEMIYFFIPLILIVIPQIIIMKTMFSGNFFGIINGWLGTLNKGAIYFTIFWIKNLGLLLPLSIGGVIISKGKIKFLYLSATFLFIICNFFKFQSWDFDNLKVLNVWEMIVIIASANYLDSLYEKNKKSIKIIVIILIILAISSGFLVIYKNFKDVSSVYSDEDQKIAYWIIQHSDKNSVFITSEQSSHPVIMLAGRFSFMGYSSWLRSWGINYDYRKKLVKEIFEGNISKKEIMNLGINYVYIGNSERSSKDYFINESFFKKNFIEVYHTDTLSIYKV